MLRAGYYEEAIGQEMNLASGVEIRIIDLATMINELTGNTAEVRFVERRKWDTKSRLLASVERAKRLIGYEPKVPFAEGLENTIAWVSFSPEHWSSSSVSTMTCAEHMPTRS